MNNFDREFRKVIAQHHALSSHFYRLGLQKAIDMFSDNAELAPPSVFELIRQEIDESK